MAVTRLSDPTPRMTLSRALLSEALRLARSPLTAVHSSAAWQPVLPAASTSL